MSQYTQIRSTAANVGCATEYALTAHMRGDTDTALAWEKVASDLVYMGRAIARDTWHPSAVEAMAKGIYERWDALKAQVPA